MTTTTATSPKAHTITLDKPIERGDTQIASVSIRKPVASELNGLAISDLVRLETSSVLQVLPRITEPSLVPHEVNAMDPADLFQCATVVATFFLPSAVRADLDQIGAE